MIENLQSEERQREFEINNLNALINNTEDLMWSVDTNFNLITSNRPFDDMLILMSGTSLPKGANVLTAGFSKEALVRFKTYYQRAFEDEAFKIIEHTLTPFEIWSEISFYPIRKENKVIGTACHSRNITKIKQAEQELSVTSSALKNALNEISKIMDSSLDVICAVDENGRFVKVSAASKRVWGYEPDELIGKNLFDLVYYEDHEQTRIMAERVMKGIDTIGFENRYVRKDGSLVDVNWSVRWDPKDKIRYGVARDVTQKKKLQRAYEMERQRFYDLFFDAPLSMGILRGPSHVYELVNPLYYELIGKTDILGKTVAEVLPEIVEQGFIQLLDDVYVTGQTYTASERLIKLDPLGNGRLVERYLNFMYQAHRTDEGNIDGILFFVVDVTELVISRKKIEKSEARLKEAQALAHVGHWELNFSTQVANWSDEACRIYGLPLEENHQTYESWLSFVHPDDFEYVMEAIHKAQQSLSEIILKHCIILKDGTVKHIISTTKFEFDDSGKPIGLYGVAHDVTEMRMAENAIKESNERYQLATKATNDVLWDWNLETNKIYRSDNYFEQFGYPPSAENVYNESWVNNLHEEDKEYTVTSMTDIIKNTEASIWQCDYRFYRSNGELVYIKDEGHIVRDKNGKALRMVGAMHDVTEQKLAEEKLIRQNAELSKTNQELDRFVYSVSHDLRSPLTSILGLLHFVESETKEPHILQYAGMIRTSINRQDEFIKNILNYSKNNRAEIEIEQIDVAADLEEIVVSLRNLKDAEGVNIVVDINQDKPFFSDKQRFNTVMGNLISNALKYHKKDVPGRFIKVTGYCDNDNLHLAIADNGIGIPPEYHGRIFDMFFRLSSKATGSGIGLYIVKETITKLKGTISLESEEGIGTTFTLTLKNLQPFE